MAQEAGRRTFEDIRAKILEIRTNDGSNAASKNLSRDIRDNNLKICMLAELFQQKAKETKIQNKNDPKIELIKDKKVTIKLLQHFLATKKAENAKLREHLVDLKVKRKEKRFFDKNKEYYVEFREKLFPMWMQDVYKKKEQINELNACKTKNISEFNLKQLKRELEKAKKESVNLKIIEDKIVEVRRQNEAIEVETCRIQVQNIDMETEIRSFDEFVLENEIASLQEKIMNAKEAKFQKEEAKSKEEEFKNPNDFPTLLDFLDKSKELKQKKKRKLASPSRPPSKRRKNKTGSYSQHDKTGKLKKSGQVAQSSSQVLSPLPNHQMSTRGSKNREKEKVQVMESYGLKKVSANTSADSSPQTSPEQGNMLQRTYSSANLGKDSPRPTLQRQKSVMQLNTPPTPKTRNSRGRSKTPEYETDKEGNLLLQRFPSKPLLVEEPKPRKAVISPPKLIHKPPKPSQIPTKIAQSPAKVAKIGESSAKAPQAPVNNGSLERMETDVNIKDARVAKQPSVDRGLRPRKDIKPKKLSPKMAEKKENNRKKVKSPKKDVKRGRPKKKANKIGEIEMMVDETSSSIESNSDGNKMIIDDNIPTTSGDNVDTLMAVDENPVIENSGNSNATSTAESTENNVMDVDQNAQNQEIGVNLPDISANGANEVDMEQESPGNDTDVSNIFDLEMENIDPNKTGDGSVGMTNSFEQLFGSSPNTSGNLDFNQSFNFNFNNSREMGESDSGGNKEADDFFNFGTDNDDFFGNNSFKSNEGKADDFF